MRRLTTTTLSALLCLTLAACGGSSDDGNEELGDASESTDESGGDGDGDGAPGDGDGAPGDGDGAPGDGDGDGDGGPGPLDGPFDGPNTPFCGVFHFDGNYGSDYDSALMVLDAQIAGQYPSYYLQSDMIPPPVYDYYHNEVNRDFWVISILDSQGGVPLQSLNDILDDEGNHYWIDWCPD